MSVWVCLFKQIHVKQLMPVKKNCYCINQVQEKVFLFYFFKKVYRSYKVGFPVAVIKNAYST